MVGMYTLKYNNLLLRIVLRYCPSFGAHGIPQSESPPHAIHLSWIWTTQDEA
jgi:hypothetical protein